mmetsp:Transcript_69489/g.192302  ORF Transcript_69489/g.192302 Transcript_69489/m.192302 type:complete len:319 (+) Transcript_69489:28-984(+)
MSITWATRLRLWRPPWRQRYVGRSELNVTTSGTSPAALRISLKSSFPTPPHRVYGPAPRTQRRARATRSGGLEGGAHDDLAQRHVRRHVERELAHLGDVLGQAGLALEAVGLPCLVVFLDLLVRRVAQQRRLHHARRHHDDAHARLGHLGAHALGDGMHAELGGAVNGVVGEDLVARDAADVDDGARAALLHAADHAAHAVEHTQHVHVDHGRPLAGVLRRDVAQQHAAGVVDEAGRGPVLLLCGLHGGREGGQVADVHARDGRARQLQRLHGLFAPSEQEERMPSVAEGLGNSHADATAGPRDDDESLAFGSHYEQE